MRVLTDRRFLPPLRMVVPELFAHVRIQSRHRPGSPAVTRLDQTLEIFVFLHIRIEKVPHRHMQRRDTGAPPTGREIVEIDAAPVRRIEESPQLTRLETRLSAQIRQRLHDVGESLMPLLAGRHRQPQGRTRALPHARHQRRAIPAFAAEDHRLLRQLVARNLHCAFPHDRELGIMSVDHAAGGYRLAGPVDNDAEDFRRR